MTRISSLLLVEDNPGDARLFEEMLNDQGVHNTKFVHVETMADAELHLSMHAVDVILLDLGLADAAGVEAVRRAHAAAPGTPLVVLTGTDDEILALEALQEGAQDYLIKGQIEIRGLLRALRFAVERESLEEALFDERALAQVTLNCIGDAVVCTDIDGNITFLNRMAEITTGWSTVEAKGLPISEVVRILDATSREVILKRGSMDIAHHGATDLPSNAILVRRDGFELPIEDSVALIHDREGRETGTVVVFHDVTAARAVATKLEHIAQHDYLTGLPNRMLLNDRIGQAIALAPRHRKKVAVLFLDLNGFKQINDDFGHATGDRILQSVAGRLVGCVRGSDTVSRQGGDEFVVLLSEVAEAGDAAITAKRMMASIAEAHRIDGHDLCLTVSVGISVFPQDGLDAATLIRSADAAMYSAKKFGLQSYQFFSEEGEHSGSHQWTAAANSDTTKRLKSAQDRATK